MVGNGTGLAATGRRAGRWTGRWRAGAIGLAAGLGALLTLGVASPALAHTRLVSSDPQPGTTVDHPVAGITLSFTDPLLDGYATITVTGPDGQASAAGPAQISGRSVTQPVGALASGNYRVGWRVVSTDGHPVEGTFMFAVALPVTGAPAPSGPAPSGPAPSGPAGAAAASQTAATAAATTPATVASVDDLLPETPYRQVAVALGGTVLGGTVLGALAVTIVVLRRRRRRDLP